MEDNEKRFEQDIESFLTSTIGGYKKGNQKTYNLEKAIDMDELISFISSSQPKEWERQVKRDGEEATKKLYKCLQTNIDNEGLIYVLRHGIIDRGIKFRIVYYQPETAINEGGVITKYNHNILTCTRQFRYSTQNTNTIDMVLSLNGIPIIALELKNQLKGQSVDNAKNQFMYDRNPKEFIFGFNNRVLVYFAVDLYEVAMTTHLNGKNTYFLPFNQGSNGAGEVGGAGNPMGDGEEYITYYLWEKVLQKDALLDILQRFIHLSVEEKTEKVNGKRTKKVSKKIIFPRYHQLDVVTKLIEDVKINGSGKNYLIQHSAGSGKSNSIAWLSYRLATLHDNNDKNIFTSVIVVTDRRVLDSQLQDTISGFDHIEGMVETIDEKKKSTDLRDAINDGKKIIITTLQKFPVIYEEIDDNKGKRFAIIVDEAHSSQTGNSAKKLKAGLADVEEALKEYAEIESVEEIENDEEDKLVKEMVTHGKHKNLSFFAFTATPKEKTLEMFGEKQEDGFFKAFHVYSMRQAIEEEFILDVLKNYMTYKTCYKIAKNTPDNPEVPSTKAVKAVRRYQELHPHNLQQKTAVMIEQFREITKNKIGGNAKAMVVTASRLHAVRYYFEFKRYIEKNHYNDLDILIAFSGVVNDVNEHGDTVPYTEEGMNKREDGTTIKEKQLPEEFHHDFNCLIVAEKYQTGFDEPLLHTMFVDKKLDGVKAVQTLSRLNRTCKGKEDTFILDFVNTTEDMKVSFSRFYEATTLDEEVNVNLIYQAQSTLRKYKLYNNSDIESFIKIYYKSSKQTDKDLGKMTALLKPVVDRYNELEIEDRYEFRMTIRSFNKWYSYIAQVVRMFDKDLQKEFAFTSYLAKMLPKEKDKKIDLDDKLKLEFYKLEETFKGDISLNPTEDDETLKNVKSFIPQSVTVSDDDLLENIIKRINDRFNGSFTKGDGVIIETIYNRVVKDNKKLKTYAENNESEVYERSIFPEIFKKITQDCYMESMSSFAKLFEDKKFYNSVMEEIARASYRDLRSDSRVAETTANYNV